MSTNPLDILTKKKKKNPLDIGGEEDSIFSQDYSTLNNAVSNNPLNIVSFATPQFKQAAPILSQAMASPPNDGTNVDPITGGIQQGFRDIWNDIGGVAKFLGGAASDAMEILRTGLYGVTKFGDTILDEMQNPNQNVLSKITAIATPTTPGFNANIIVNAAKKSFSEMFSNVGEVFDKIPALDPETQEVVFKLAKTVTPAEKLSVKDVLKQHFPELTNTYPITTSLLGFVGDIAADPMTYVSFGTDTGIKLAGEKVSNRGLDLIGDLEDIAKTGFSYTLKNSKTGVERTGEVGVAELQRLAHIKDLVTFSEDAIAGDKTALGMMSTILNANTKGFKGKLTEIRKLTPSERSWDIEQNFVNMARMDDSLLIKGGDLGMFLNIPLSARRVTVIPPKAVDYVLEKTGIKQVMDGISNRLQNSEAVAAFSRNIPLEEYQAYQKARSVYWGELNVGNHQMFTAIGDYVGLPKESRQRLGDLAVKINATISARSDLSKLTPQNISMIRSSIINKAVKAGDINTEEFNTIGKFIQAHNTLASNELQSHLIKQINDSYAFFNESSIGKAAANKLGVMQSNDLDIAALYALRARNNVLKQAVSNFDSALESMFGTVNAEGKLIMNIPKNVQRDIDFIGTSAYKTYINNSDEFKTVDNFLKYWKMYVNSFKVTAYGARISPTFKQAISNQFNGFAQFGVSAFRGLDPRSIVDAIIMAADNSAYSKYIPQRLLENIQMYGGTSAGRITYAIDKQQPNLVKDLKYINRLGVEIDGPQLYDEVMRTRMYDKGLNILNLDQSKNFDLMMAKQEGWWAFQKEKWHQGVMTAIKETLPWINFPGYIENINRTALYLNARRLGYFEDQASEKVMKALFDYTHGTTAFENKFMKSIVPFYTFQRFAVPLIGSLVKEPGRISNLNKITKEFFEIYNLWQGGQKLSDAQRSVLPGFILEQPSVYDGIKKDDKGLEKGYFSTFNSFSFTDWLSLIQPNEDGSINLGATIQKMGLATLVPLLKMPIELLADKNFFTQTPISKGGKIATGEYAEKISSPEFVDFYNKNIPDDIKHLIGFEVKTDPVTGEQSGYVNPYLTYTMTNFVPAIHDFINIPRDNLTAREATMRLLTGVGQIKLDFQKAQSAKIMEIQKQIRDLQSEIRKDMTTNNIMKMDEDQKKLQLLISKQENFF